MSKLTKNELAKQVMHDIQCNRQLAIQIVDDIFDIVTSTLARGENVTIPRLGNFTVRSKKARIGRNPKTKEAHVISPRKVVSFRSSNMLKTTLKSMVRK